MKRTCWDTRATDSIIKSGQKDTEASITGIFSLGRGGKEVSAFGLPLAHSD